MTPSETAHRIVIKVGTSTLTYESGKPNIRRVEALARVLSDLHNSGKEIVLVSSGALGVGVGKLGLEKRPTEVEKRQAVAAVGQCELMFLYDKMFSEYTCTVAQVLLTPDVIDDQPRKQNVINTLDTLLKMGIIPVVNENDTVSTAEIAGANFGDNDRLSAIVAKLINADMLVLLTDIDGLHDGDPRKNKNAVRIPVVLNIDENVMALAGGTGSVRGTGGMVTKLQAAELACEAGIETYIINGENPKTLYKLLDGETVGTHFVARRKNNN
ncbi:MAG: glutamate 5-kinase [Clostridia bacterium]|nr:glutamate 5-kinase [Clostridia bacterium]